MEGKQATIRVLMLPWLAYGHISPFLELAKKLAKRNFFIYLSSTQTNLVSIKEKLGEEYSLSIQLVELLLPCLPDLPPHHHTTSKLPPHLMETLKHAFDSSAHASFSEILRTLNPDLLIYDFLQPWAPAVASSFNIPAVEFLNIGACMNCFYKHFFEDSGADFPFPEIYLSDFERTLFAEMGDCERLFECMRRSSKIILIKTFREIEGKWLDHLNDTIDKKMVPVGPLVQEQREEGISFGVVYAQRHSIPIRRNTMCGHSKSSDLDSGCKSHASFSGNQSSPEHLGDDLSIRLRFSIDYAIRWLDSKDPISTVFVSFGSEYFLSEEERQEIAHGLELSKVNFIWVIRFPTGEEKNVEQELPEGFFQTVGERGLVVEGWAPQMKILGHPNIGGFVSHCGWSSVMESMRLGVPIIAMPMHLDQPINARLVAALGVGVEVKRGENDGKFGRGEIARLIREMVKGKGGEEVRRKAKKMSDIMIKKDDEEINDVVSELVQLCKERK
ncbi:hypothetical protein Nepgr_001305 [Nepenthes gracilis]|uniref:Glycosyltransferase n=1 Tax=Nepenthes gracilis TaxID=150966 RepID=A0AAD3RXC4_NEPGR|nr:hypothetical protein Nepgr_001305 [Nepenthes gracilis]